jgi:hypothetical protein
VTACKSCDKPIEIGQTFIGFPVIRLTAVNASQMAGNEILFHLTCFLSKFGRSKVEIIKP